MFLFKFFYSILFLRFIFSLNITENEINILNSLKLYKKQPKYNILNNIFPTKKFNLSIPNEIKWNNILNEINDNIKANSFNFISTKNLNIKEGMYYYNNIINNKIYFNIKTYTYYKFWKENEFYFIAIKNINNLKLIPLSYNQKIYNDKDELCVINYKDIINLSAKDIFLKKKLYYEENNIFFREFV